MKNKSSKSIVSFVVSVASFVLLFAQNSWAQGFGIGGDQISSTVNTASSYLQKLALGFFVILLIIAGVRVALDPEHRSGLSVVWGCIIGIAITVLAPVIVQVVQGWSGGIMGY